MRRKIPAEVRRRVRLRARSRCEYCHTSETWQYVPFTIDHIVPLSARGGDDFENLALACFHCNRRKWDTSTSGDLPPGIEPSIPIFNPRKDRWPEHFIWSADGSQVVPLTPTGQVTVAALELNGDRIQRIRSADFVIGRHPPPGDPRLGQ
ncbi:MAG TPA: HNH endonuclease signature motif containing protein [Blastocatellia bacterium]